MTLPLNPKHLKRYKDIAALLIKYGRGDLLKGTPIVDDPLEYAPAPPIAPEAKELADDLEKLGPTFIKFGQLISTRSDFVPQTYMDALSRLQDNVEPFDIDQVEAIVTVEIGARMSRAFAEFDPTPIAAASLGQVHSAVLRNGQRVAVKVQRPGVREQVAEDLEAMAEIAGTLDEHTDIGRQFGFGRIVDELRKSLLRELDYRLEAANLRLMKSKLAGFERILIPEPVDDYSTGRVLTMEHISGHKITKLSPITRLELDGAELAEAIFSAYLHQILILGVFHADPHPGNVFLTEDHRIALLDLGMVARIGSQMQENILRLLLAISEGQSDRAAEIAQKMGEEQDGFESIRFRREISELVSQQQGATVGQMQVGSVVMKVTQVAGQTRLGVPSELTMLGKTLLNLDLIGRTLCPEFDPNESIRRNSAVILRERTMKSLAPGSLLTAMLEAKELVETLPRRLNQLFDMVTGNKLKVRVDAIDENLVMAGLQKVANRIALGLILASLILGAALLMRIDTSFRIWGYPGLAMIFFLLASAGGLALAVQILRSDTRQK
jgi:predicted unusual protein kinase regulating ubiquinone biosynthesis (AarF/ABC1/UbiB family)